MMVRSILAIAAAGFLWTANAQDAAGLWLGTLDVGPTKLRLALHVTRSDKGLAATLDSLDQGANGIPVTVLQHGRNIKLEIKVINGAYEGAINDKGTEISGTWKQSVSLPLVFRRTEKVPEVARPQEPKLPYPYDEVEVGYENRQAGVKFAGTLTLPRTGAPYAAVLLITGSGPQDRNEAIAGHKPFLVLADSLTRRGIAVLRVDDRGTGGSTGKIDEGTTEDFIGDVLAGVEFLKSRKEIDARRIGLAGHSEGGLIAPMAAARSKDVAFVVLLAGPGVPGEKIIAAQSYAIPRAMGASEEGAATNRDVAMLMVDSAIHETDPAAVEKRFQDRLAGLMAGWSEAQRSMIQTIRPQLQTQMKTITSPWFRTFLTLDPRRALMKVEVPLLALNGELDTQVLAQQNLPAIVEALEAGGNKDYTVTKLPGLNHLFQTAKTGAPDEYARIPETMAPVALQVIGDWILRHTAR